MNIQTRLFYDKDVACNRDDTSSAALKWYTADTQQNRALEHNHANDIHVSTDLSRGKTTRNTDKDGMNTELYGTAPYMYLRSGDNSQVDVESQLLHKQMDGMNNCDRKPLYTETYFDQNSPLVVETQRGGASSRNERIAYGSMQKK